MKGALFEEYLASAIDSPAPLLDWRDTGSYLFIKQLDNTQLAWEFLRRCPEYRADFAEWYEQWRRLVEMGRTESYLDWFPVRDAMEVLCEKWDLWPIDGLGVPSSKLPPAFKGEPGARSPMLIATCFDGRVGDRSPRVPSYSPSVTIRIHLDHPIASQLASAKRMILRLAEEYGVRPPRRPGADKRRTKNSYRYIQLLDAHLAGISQAEMAKELYGTGKAEYDKAGDHLAAAKKVAREGYLGVHRAPED